MCDDEIGNHVEHYIETEGHIAEQFEGQVAVLFDNKRSNLNGDKY